MRKPLKSEALKVRVPDQYYSRLVSMADEGRKNGVMITRLAERAFQFFLDHVDQKGIDWSAQPRTKEEKEIVHMVLAFMREPNDTVGVGILEFIRHVYGNRR